MKGVTKIRVGEEFVEIFIATAVVTVGIHHEDWVESVGLVLSDQHSNINNDLSLWVWRLNALFPHGHIVG